ncbi:MAG: branched-chain amino acid aminotransferase [Rhodothermales bacterium]|jgi:branched-chain amino acid aminotransferase
MTITSNSPAKTRFAYFEGAIVPIEEARVPLTCNTLHYGTGCFGGIRAFWSEEDERLYLFRAAEHYQRLLRSAKIILAEVDYTIQQLIDITVQLLQKEGFRQNAYVRPLIYKDDGVFRVQLHDANDKLGIFSQPVGAYIKASGALHVAISSWRRVDDNMIPARGKLCGSYINSALAKSEANLAGYDEALELNHDGHVSEASAANFFMVRDGVLITPPVTSNVLEGITRRTVMHIAQEDLGIPVVEREIDRSELFLADEAFLCGTGVQVAAIGKVEHRTVGTGEEGPICSAIRDLNARIVTGRVPKYMDWLTPVP